MAGLNIAIVTHVSVLLYLTHANSSACYLRRTIISFVQYFSII